MQAKISFSTIFFFLLLYQLLNISRSGGESYATWPVLLNVIALGFSLGWQQSKK